MKWMEKTSYLQISEWDLATCITFLTASETTQKRLPGTPTSPSRPCSVKRLVVQQIMNLTKPCYTNNNININNNNSLSQVVVKPTDLSELLIMLGMINLQFFVICSICPAYRTVSLSLNLNSNPDSIDILATNSAIQNHFNELGKICMNKTCHC